MPKLLGALIASILSITQPFLLPFAALNTATVAQADQAAAQPVLTGLYNLTSPDVVGSKMFMSGMLDSTQTESAIYESDNLGNGWAQPVQVFALPGYNLSDPSVIAVGADLFMYYTKISDADAAATTTLALHNIIGLARSQDGGSSWEDLGVIIDQNNGIDVRGGWAPGVLYNKDYDAIWLYFSTNGPGTVAVYRASLDTTGRYLTQIDKVYYGDGDTTPLSAFNVDVTFQNPQYTMLANEDLSGIVRYVSDDGLHWRTQSGDTNPIIAASSGSIIGAPMYDMNTTNPSVYFSAGSLADKRWSSLWQDAAIGSAPLSSAAAVDASGASITGGSNGSSSSSSSGGSMLAVVGLLGIAGIAGLALLGGATVAAPVAAAAATAGSVGKELLLKSFGGRIVSINYCIHGAININILPAGLFPISYVWSPATLTFPPWQPPNHIGQEVLGLANPIPIPCVGFGTHPPIWMGLNMFMVGTSPI